jgi:hypothetical protein
MKKYLLIAGFALVTAGGVTAAVLNNGKKKTTKITSSKSCMGKTHCSRSAKTACY